MKLLKNLLFYRKKIFFYRQGNKKNIIILANRRGASTLLAECIAINAGIFFVFEPFALSHNLEAKQHLPPKLHAQFIDLSADEESRVYSYLQGLMQARYRQRGYVLKTKFPLYADRTLLKVVNAGPMVNWFAKNFDVYLVHLLRHPASQTLSVLHNKWGLGTSAYLQNEYFITHYLSSEQFDFAQRVDAEGSLFERGVLLWLMQNLVQLNHAEIELFRITLEELILHPNKTVKRMSDYLQLEGFEQMMAQIVGKPSGTANERMSSPDMLKAIRENDKQLMLKSWLDKVSLEDKKRAQLILDTFGVTIYTMDSPIPATMDKFLT